MPYFYDYRPAPAARAGAYRRKYGTTWWGAQFLAALQRADWSGRLARGKTYANKGLVLDIQTTGPGRLTAKVQGSFPWPYQLGMHWKPWTAAQAGAVQSAITDNPALLARLLAGELPETLFTVLRDRGLHLFPEDFGQLGLHCDCPDYATPCKHQAALLYVIAADIDGDPFQLFKLRGLDLRAVLADYATAAEAQTTVTPVYDLLQPVGVVTDYYWDETAYLALRFDVVTDAGRRAVAALPPDPPFDGEGDLLSFLDKIYAAASRTARKLFAATATEATDPTTIIPPGGQLELHLSAFLEFDHLTSYDAADTELLSLDEPTTFLNWLQQVELLDRHYLDDRARTLLLYFQLARRMAEAGAFVPELLAGEVEGDYFLRFVPATNAPALVDLLERVYALASPTLLYRYSEMAGMEEPRPEHGPRTLLSLLLTTIVTQALLDGRLSAEAPVRRLFLLQNPQRFTLVGTAGFPAAIARWLSELHLADLPRQPVFRIEELDDALLVDVLVQERTGGDVPRPPEGGWADPANLELLTLLGKLTRHFPDLERYLAAGGTTPLRYSVAAFSDILTRILPALEALGIAVMLPAALRKLLRPRLGLRADTGTSATAIFELSGIVSLDAMLNFSWQAALGAQDLSEAEFRTLLGSADGLVKLREGYAFVDPAEARKLLAQLAAGPPELKVHERLEAVLTEEYDGAPVRLSPELRALITRMRQGARTQVPGSVEATLRPYQQTGFEWLYGNAQLGIGSVIADDMGLGKTLQVITLLEKLREDGGLKDKKALVVVPTSLLGNWRREIAKFAPALRPATYHGNARALPGPDDYDVLLTTYGILRSENQTFAGTDWRALVIDEAQAIKNPRAKQTKAIKKVPADVRVAMSGTPVENKLLDYWSLLDFTVPKLMGSQKYFRDRYARPIQGDRDAAAADRFRRLTAPFVLRRLKTDKSIISDLPDKVVQTETCTLTPEQAAVYQSIVDANLAAVEQKDGIERQGLVLKLITALKQCCNHPVQFLKRGTPTFAQSGKALLLRQRLESILEQGDKVLIFTQYRQMGELLARMIREEFGLEAPFLHGGVPAAQREEMVDRFQHDPAYPIFLLSIKAAGTGLNLTAANHVVHYDLWWNPAVENQATDRAYRIGQERTVFVHRLVTEHTFEEKIDTLIQSKRDLAELSVGEGAAFLGRMSNGELRGLVSL